MKTKILCALVLFAAACSGTNTTTGSSSSDTLALKKAAAEAAAPAPGKIPPSEDVCVQHAWYGDGVCDTFCAQNDSDCVPDGSGTVCAAFTVSDGTCTRAADDPCRFQDGDCEIESMPPSSGDDVACAAISEVSDGVCKRPDTDPCRTQDPDCKPLDDNGGGSAGDSNGGGSDPGHGVACPAIVERPNGKCELPYTDPCRSIDPDCVVACAAYIEQSDGECKRDLYDPCFFQDPDCKVK